MRRLGGRSECEPSDAHVSGCGLLRDTLSKLLQSYFLIMRIFTTNVFIALLAAVTLAACDSFVSEVEEPIDVVTNEALNTPEQVPFLITGVQASFAFVHEDAAVQAGGLADELFFDRQLDGATFDTFEQIDDADIQFANNSVDGFFNNVGELRLYSDTLVSRVQNQIEFGEGQQALRDEALFTGHFYGAVARYYYAAYFGLEAGAGGGGAINNGPFIPSNEMYDLALGKLDDAAATATGQEALNAKYISTMRARIHLLKDEYGAAASAAVNGLVEGDASLSAQYSAQQANDFFNASGPGRTQFAAAPRLADYDGAVVYGSATEAADADRSVVRIPLYQSADTDGDPTFLVQAKYLDRSTPIDFLSWEENALMLAELAVLHGQDISGNPFGTTDPLALINLVRTQYEGVDALPGGATVDQALIAAEREKEFFVTGLRLLDQRRFDIPFVRQNLDIETGTVTVDPVAGNWRYLPITQSERNQNPNF